MYVHGIVDAQTVATLSLLLIEEPQHHGQIEQKHHPFPAGDILVKNTELSSLIVFYPQMSSRKLSSACEPNLGMTQKFRRRQHSCAFR